MGRKKCEEFVFGILMRMKWIFDLSDYYQFISVFS